MPHNILLTGPPRSGKTTVIERSLEMLEDHGLEAGGVLCPEIRTNDERRGFTIVDVVTGESNILAHVDQDEGPSVGKYRVNVPNVDAACERAFETAFEEADFLVVDEIAPMEIRSTVFTTHVRRALDSDLPLIGVVNRRSTSGFIGDVKNRPDVELLEVTRNTRDELPKRVTRFVLERTP
ncbi:MAG: NTPase [Halodesulfurarchaeum sp.]